MAQFSLTYPDGQGTRILDKSCIYLNYDANQLPGETKVQFVKRMLGETIKTWVREAELVSAYKSTQETVTDDVNNTIIIT